MKVLLFLLVSPMLVLASATNFYVTPSGTATGNCPGGTTPAPNIAFASMSSANWGSGTGQIGPGTTVLLCGTMTASAAGSCIQVLNSGTSGGGYITIDADTGYVCQATYIGNANLGSAQCG